MYVFNLIGDAGKGLDMDGGKSGYRAGAERDRAELPRLDLEGARRRQPQIAHAAHPGAPAYDLLRTRLLGEMSSREWTRLGVTQSGVGRAGPLAALNLALSEARRPGRSIVLVDLDIARQPILGQLGAATGPQPAPGEQPGLSDGTFTLWQLAERLALIAVPAPPVEAATRLLDPDFQDRLDEALAKLSPDMVILHLPPLLAGDAGIAGLPLVQGLLLVVDGRSDTAARLRDCQSRIGETCPILGLFHFDAEV